MRNLRDKKKKKICASIAKFPNEIAPNSQMATEKFG